MLLYCYILATGCTRVLVSLQLGGDYLIIILSIGLDYDDEMYTV